MGTVDLTPKPTAIIVAQDNDKVMTAGPFKIGGVVIPRTGKRLRFVVKATATTDDDDAVVDLNSVDDPLVVYGAGADATGVWVIDIRNVLPPPIIAGRNRLGSYHLRVDMTAVASLSTDREEVAVGTLTVKPT